MMLALTFILLLLLFWGLGEITLGWMIRKGRIRLHEVRRREVSQRLFAEARNALVLQVATGGLAASSETFRLFYWLTTTLMRRPDQYKTLSEDLRNKLLTSEKKEVMRSALEKELGSWPEEVHQIVLKILEALDHFLVDHHAFWRLITAYLKQKGVTFPFMTILGIRQRDKSVEASGDRYGGSYRTATDEGSRELRTILQETRRELASWSKLPEKAGMDAGMAVA
jgi:hypothetical protein